MRQQQTQYARQYARPGCCFDKPIVIDDDEQAAPARTKAKPIFNHTATWLEAKASDRWQASTTTRPKRTFTNMATSLEGNAGGRWQGSVNRPAVGAEPAQRCRKRALPEIGDDTDDTNGGAKRLRLSGMEMAGSEGFPTQDIPHANTQPFQSNSRSHFANNSHLSNRSHLANQSHLTNHSNLTNPDDENSASNLAELETGLRTMQRKIDLERATIRDTQRAEEQARIQEEETKAREAEMRDQNYRSAIQSSLHKMWQDCDRDREAAQERRNTREREEREEAQRKEREAERERNHELSNIEANLKSMWNAHDLERGVPSGIRPGQLSEAGQRRVRQRAENLRRQNQWR